MLELQNCSDSMRMIVSTILLLHLKHHWQLKNVIWYHAKITVTLLWKDIKKFSTINDDFISCQLVSYISKIVYLNSFTRVSCLPCIYTGLCKKMKLNNNDRVYSQNFSTDVPINFSTLKTCPHTGRAAVRWPHNFQCLVGWINVFLEYRLTKDRGREDVTVFWRYITVGIKKDYAISQLTYTRGFY